MRMKFYAATFTLFGVAAGLLGPSPAAQADHLETMVLPRQGYRPVGPNHHYLYTPRQSGFHGHSGRGSHFGRGGHSDWGGRSNWGGSFYWGGNFGLGGGFGSYYPSYYNSQPYYGLSYGNSCFNPYYYGGFYSPTLSIGVGGFGYGNYIPYPVAQPSERVYVERQLIVTPGSVPYTERPERASSPETNRDDRTEPAPVPRKRDEGDPPRRESGERGFYLVRPVPAETLAGAIADIRRAWLNGDYSRLSDRFPKDRKIRIYPGGRYGYSMSGAEFARVTRTALAAIETTGFDFDPVPTAVEEGQVLVTGKHTYKAAARASDPKREQVAHVSYRLELHDGLWRVVEAGSSEQPIKSHED